MKKDETISSLISRGGIMVSIKTRKGYTYKKGLDHQDIKTLVEKLEVMLSIKSLR